MLKKEIKSTVGVFIGVKGLCQKEKPIITGEEEDSHHMINGFINAVTNNRPEDIKPFLSKRLKATASVNLEALQEVFQKSRHYKHLEKARFTRTHHKIKTNSILIIHAGVNRHNILHLHLIREPDLYGNWKICAIEKE